MYGTWGYRACILQCFKRLTYILFNWSFLCGASHRILFSCPLDAEKLPMFSSLHLMVKTILRWKFKSYIVTWHKEESFIRDGPLETTGEGGGGVKNFWWMNFLKKPACLQEFFSRAYDLLFLGITACRIFFRPVSLAGIFFCELSPHLRLFPMVRPLVTRPLGFSRLGW